MKLLVANRGEIALRIIRACRKLGLKTVAVYSDADRHALHTRQADEAYLLGPAPATESYLAGEKIIKIAKKSGAKLIHPGYGFLSENADFARACEKANLLFVGPSSHAMTQLGDKAKARKLAAQLKIPVVAGSTQEVKSVAQAKEICRQMGLPILIKAVGGGGGKGIRIVRKMEELPSAFSLASSEAKTAFKNPCVFMERYLEGARHIEIQVLADKKGNCVSLGERECSIQRRFQKLIEESPSSFINPPLRAKMEAAAKKLISTAGYTNAGTVEFLVDKKRNFYFLEVNVRLQVEHPVTEMVREVDLVCEQIKVALGKELSFDEKKLPWNGHAIEVRIYAEDPENRFFPSVGKVTYLETPRGEQLRLESALFPGMEVSLHYDPLLAKLIAWGKTREQAIQRLQVGLSEFIIDGVKTTIPFFLELLHDPAFRQGEIHTQFLDQWLTRTKEKGQEWEAACAALLYHVTQEKKEKGSLIEWGKRLSPWQLKPYEQPRTFGRKRI